MTISLLAKREALGVRPRGIFVDNAWRPATGGRTHMHRNPRGKTAGPRWAGKWATQIDK